MITSKEKRVGILGFTKRRVFAEPKEKDRTEKYRFYKRL